jgi:uncharacterized protein YjbI with pentapeptide repeats
VNSANFFAATFDQCKLLGWDFREGLNLTATTFTGCSLDYALLRGVDLAKQRFERCSFVEADLSLANLTEAAFMDCDLSNVDLQETTFRMTDLRGSNLTGWNLKRHDLAGIVITSAQAATLAEALGIQVLDPRRNGT